MQEEKWPAYAYARTRLIANFLPKVHWIFKTPSDFGFFQ